MQLPVTRHLRPRESTSIGPWALLGFGAGIAAGFLLGEAFGTGGKTRVIRLVKRLTNRPASESNRITLAARIKTSLAAEPGLNGEALEPLPAGPRGLALHGWVGSRAVRTRAWRLAQHLAGPVPVANRLLVRGEDDAPLGPDTQDEPRSA